MKILDKRIAVSLAAALFAVCAIAAGEAQPAEGAKSTGTVAKVEKAVAKGAHAAASGVERGVKATGRGLKRGADATERGVKRAAKATAGAANKVGSKISGAASSPASSRK
jgi:hypothetical protein